MSASATDWVGAEHPVAASVEPVDVEPHRLGDEEVAGEVERVGAELGVVGADDGNPQQLGHDQAAEADRPRRGELHDVRGLVLDALEHVQERGEAELDVLRCRQGAGPLGREIDHVVLVDRLRARGGYADHEVVELLVRREAPHRPGHTVCLREGVGEQERSEATPRGGRAAEEDLLDLCELVAPACLVVGGSQEGCLQGGREQQLRQAWRSAVERFQSEPAVACVLPERARERADCCGDVGVVCCRVLVVGVEEVTDHERDGLRKAGSACPVGVEEQRDHGVGELLRRAVRPHRAPFTGTGAVKERVQVVSLGLRPGGRDIERAVVVGAAHEADVAFVSRRETVAVGERHEGGRRDEAGEPAGELVVGTGAGAVSPLPGAKQQHHPFHMRGRDRWPHPVERVGERVRQAPVREEGLELVDRATVGLQIPVVVLAEIPDEDVQDDIVFGKSGRHLLRQERVVEVRDSQGSLDGVVVADRDEPHSACPADVVHPQRVRTTPPAGRVARRSCRCRSRSGCGRGDRRQPLPSPPLVAARQDGEGMICSDFQPAAASVTVSSPPFHETESQGARMTLFAAHVHACQGGSTATEEVLPEPEGWSTRAGQTFTAS